MTPMMVLLLVCLEHIDRAIAQEVWIRAAAGNMNMPERMDENRLCQVRQAAFGDHMGKDRGFVAPSGERLLQDADEDMVALLGSIASEPPCWLQRDPILVEGPFQSHGNLLYIIACVLLAVMAGMMVELWWIMGI